MEGTIRMQKITADDPIAASANVVAENIEQLKALFPEAVVEGKLDFEVLKGLLGGVVDEREEKYGLNWHGKRRARQLALTPSTGTLRPCPEESVDWETTQNLMIEGDNLEVLKLLQKSYAGKVKQRRHYYFCRAPTVKRVSMKFNGLGMKSLRGGAGRSSRRIADRTIEGALRPRCTASC